MVGTNDIDAAIIVGDFGACIGRGNHLGGKGPVIGRKTLEAGSVIKQPKIELEVFSRVFDVDQIVHEVTARHWLQFLDVMLASCKTQAMN